MGSTPTVPPRLQEYLQQLPTRQHRNLMAWDSPRGTGTILGTGTAWHLRPPGLCRGSKDTERPKMKS